MNMHILWFLFACFIAAFTGLAVPVLGALALSGHIAWFICALGGSMAAQFIFFPKGNWQLAKVALVASQVGTVMIVVSNIMVIMISLGSHELMGGMGQMFVCLLMVALWTWIYFRNRKLLANISDLS